MLPKVFVGLPTAPRAEINFNTKVIVSIVAFSARFGVLREGARHGVIAKIHASQRSSWNKVRHGRFTVETIDGV